MSVLIRLFVVIASFWSLSGGPFKALANAQPLIFSADPQNQMDNSVMDDSWSSVMFKRAGFWSPHQSDFNPMRRPNPVLRPSSKRDFDELLPYHPLAKAFSLTQRYVGNDDYPEAAFETNSDSRLKKHIWPANLPVRLIGSSSNLPPRKNQKYVPSEPNGNAIP